MKNSQTFIGVMSGTSLDAVDIVAVTFNPFKIVASHSFSFPDALRKNLADLTQPGDNEVEKLGRADRALGLFYADSINTFIELKKLSVPEITAIGCHGQTIRHRPEATPPFTLQIGDPNTIAHTTQITTVADFRRKDIAAGGQGAPLVPAFHHAVFSSADHERLIVNIGGIANITALPRAGDIIGFDTGPGNGLMDAWIQKNQKTAFDESGAWAASGTINSALLNALLSDTYFEQPPPKSTGRELFNLKWLEEKLRILNPINNADIQATLAELTATTIANAIDKYFHKFNQIFICGGGADNTFLMQRLETLLHPRLLASTSSLGLEPRWVEASAFAWLAKQTLEKKPGNISSVTGAKKNSILGAVYWP